MPVPARKFMHRQHRAIARMIGVVRRRPVHAAVALTNRVVVRQRNRLGVRDEKTVEMAGLRRPGAHARTRPRAVQIDGAAGPGLVAPAIRREVLLVRAPAEFGGLRALADEAVDGPCVDELVHLLRDIRHLGVAFGDVHDLDAEGLRQCRPLVARPGVAGIDAGVRGDVEQRPFHQV